MESYEEFCLRSLVMLQEGGEFKKKTCEASQALEARSVIRFHGRAVLSPLLSAEKYTEMCDLRQKAIQLEMNRQIQQRNNLMTTIQNTQDRAQACRAQSEEVDKLPLGGYMLVTNSPGLPEDPGCGLQQKDRPTSPMSENPILNGYTVVKVASDEKSDEEEEQGDISLDSLCKRSTKKEQSQHGSSAVHTANRTPPPQTATDNNGCSPIGGAGIEFGFSLHHSPIGLPQTPVHHQPLGGSRPQESSCLSPSLPDRYAHHPCPESNTSPCPQRRRPRPFSTGNIHIYFPIDEVDLIPQSPRRSGEGPGTAESSSGVRKSSDSAGSEGPGGISNRGNRHSSSSGTSPMQETCSPISASGSSPKGHHEHLVAGFRRRCHTLDNQWHNYHSAAENIARSQERVPRFMAGVTWMPSSRRTPANPLNQTYSIENPSQSLLRPRIPPDASEAQGIKTEEIHRRAQALEDMQRRLEEEHALQISLLLAEQEKEQQRLHMEFQEKERRLKEQHCVQQMSGDANGWACRSMNDSGPVASPSCPGLSPVRTPSEQSPGHSKGFPSHVNSRVSSPSIQPPVYLLGPSWAVSKPRARLSLVLTAEQQRAFCRIGAIIRGFLTRRLLKTEKVKHLRQTIVDTKEFIHSFQSDAQNRGTYTAQDHSLQERVRAQLRAALYDIHDIFFEMPLGDRLALLQQHRELRAERKLRDMERAKCPKERAILSAATQRSLDRKKRGADSPIQARKIQQKPKSPTTSRVLKSSQGPNSPIPGQLNRQGSWNRRTPEERLKRADSLKKQHSLG